MLVKTNPESSFLLKNTLKSKGVKAIKPIPECHRPGNRSTKIVIKELPKPVLFL
jgi:hypothetical protein